MKPLNLLHEITWKCRMVKIFPFLKLILVLARIFQHNVIIHLN